MCDLIVDIISCYVWSGITGEINVCDKIMIENQKKRKYGIPKLLQKSPSKIWFIRIYYNTVVAWGRDLLLGQ